MFCLEQGYRLQLGFKDLSSLSVKGIFSSWAKEGCLPTAQSSGTQTAQPIVAVVYSSYSTATTSTCSPYS